MATAMRRKRGQRPPLRSRKPRCSRAGTVTVMPSGIAMAALLKRSAPCFLGIHFSGLFENLYQLTMRHTRAGWQSGQARLLGGGPMTERSKERTYTDAEVEARLKTELPHWYRENGWILRKDRTNSWKV